MTEQAKATAYDGRTWPKVHWRWQRFLDAWLCLFGGWSLHKAWQRGMDYGSAQEYHRLIDNKAYLAEIASIKKFGP